MSTSEPNEQIPAQALEGDIAPSTPENQPDPTSAPSSASDEKSESSPTQTDSSDSTDQAGQTEQPVISQPDGSTLSCSLGSAPVVTPGNAPEPKLADGEEAISTQQTVGTPEPKADFAGPANYPGAEAQGPQPANQFEPDENVLACPICQHRLLVKGDADVDSA